MATVQDAIIYTALADIGFLRVGATPTSTVRDDAFQLLLRLMDSLSAEQVMNYVIYHQIFTLTAGMSVYTVGTGGSLVSTVRPIAITGAVSLSGNQRSPVEVMPWAEFDAKVVDPLGTRSILASKLAADQGFPSINIKVWPTPDTSPASLQLDYYAPLPVFAAVSDTITLPEGWVRMLEFNLALELMPRYERPGGVPASLAAAAANSKAAIAAKNAAILGLVQAQQQAA